MAEPPSNRPSKLSPDVVCMDVQMPVLDGLEAIRELVARGSRAHILVLTTFNRDDYLFEALAAGASGFLLKTASPEQLIEAVQVLARGDALLAPDVTRRVIARASALRPPPPARLGKSPTNSLRMNATCSPTWPPDGPTSR